METSEKKPFTETAARLDELADLHARISTLESADVTLSRRITRLEEADRGHVNDDPFGNLFSPSFVWAMVIITLAPTIIELVKDWKASKE